MKDYELIEAFQNGDEFAFVGIYNRYKGAVYAFCLKMLNDSEQAQDCMQETYLRVYENRDRLLKTGSFKSWLFTIARNQCLNRIRRNRKHVVFNEDVASTCITSDTPISRMEKNDQIRFVGCYLDRLKLEYREVLILREYQNLSYEEIAAVTRSSISAVKSRLFKARKKFASMVAPVVSQHIQSGISEDKSRAASTIRAEMKRDD